MKKDFENAPDLAKELGLALEKSAQRAVEIDVEKYQAWLDDPDLTDDQKEQMITALWQIITAFVDLGFGVHPLQQACGKLTETEAERSADQEAMVSCKADTLTDTFNNFAAE